MIMTATRLIISLSLHYALPICDFGLRRIEAACLPANIPSSKLLEKVGFTREGLAREYLCINGVWHDHLLYALLDKDPRSEEHTSGLQSRENLICRLLLEKYNM